MKKGGQPKPGMLYFNDGEVRALALGLGGLIDTYNELRKGNNVNIPWTPEARAIQGDIMKNVFSAAAKLEKFTGIKCDLPPYMEGDEDEFLTKQS